jgi:hypothetical protein
MGIALAEVSQLHLNQHQRGRKGPPPGTGWSSGAALGTAHG